MLRRSAPRNDAGALREFILQLSNNMTCRRTSSPRVQFGHRASRLISVRVSRRERAERFGEKPLSRPLASQASIPHTAGKDNGTGAVVQLKQAKIASTEPGPRKQPFACAPHADGFVGLLDVPGLRACASLPVRADCRPDIHSCRPLPLPWSAPCAFVGP